MNQLATYYKIKRQLSALQLNDRVRAGSVAEYNFKKRVITLPNRVLESCDIHSCAVGFHEVGHAWQNARWPFLFNYTQWYLPNLFIEWQASYIALGWLKEIYFGDGWNKDFDIIRTYYRKSLLSYAIPWKRVERLY